MAGWWTILVVTWRRMGEDSLSILAAGIAFQTFFSLFPTLTAVVSLYGLVADPGMVGRQISAVQGVLPPESALAIVYRYAPDREEPQWQWISWGSVAATALWILGSIAFTTYVSKVGSYDRTYGSLGGVIILLLWFYLTAYVILAGARNSTRKSSVKPHLQSKVRGSAFA